MCKRTWRRSLVLFAVLALTVLATAQGASGRTSQPAGVRADPVTLTIWDAGTIDPKYFKIVDAAFMKAHPNITIKRVTQPLNSYYTLIQAAIATKKGPDSFNMPPGPFMFDYYRGLLPLKGYVSADDKKKLTGWSTAVAKDGTPYGVPWTAQGLNFYFNKAMFKQAGLDPNAPPTTWNGLLAACDALKAKGITPIVAGWKDGYMAEWWVSVIASQYQSSDELGKAISDPNWQSPSIVKAFDRMKELKARGCFTADAEGIPLFPDAVNNFKSGKGAMMLGLSASAINWNEFRKTAWGKKNLGAFLPPLMPDGLWKVQRYNYVPNLVNVITKWSKHPKETYQYLSYLVNKPNQELAFKMVGQFPNRTDVKPVTKDPVGAEIVGWTTSKKQFVGQMIMIRAAVEPIFDKIVPQVMSGQASIDDQLKLVQAAQDRTKPIPDR